MYAYYVTDGKSGKLLNTGYSSTQPTEGLTLDGEYTHVGSPPANYYTKASKFDLWDTGSLSWTKNPNEMAELALEAEKEFQLRKGNKLTDIKLLRQSTEFGPFTYNGMVFDGDADAQRRLSGVVSAAKSAIAAGQTFTKEFTLADNSVVQLTAEDFVGIEMAKIWQIDVAFQEYRIKKAAIEAATTLEELEAIPV